MRGHPLDEPETQRVGRREERKARATAREHPLQLFPRVATQQEAHRDFPGTAERDRLPPRQQLASPHEAQVRIGLVQVPLVPELLHEPERAHHRHLGRARELRRVAIAAPRRREQVVGQFGGEQHLQHPLVQVREQVGAVGRRVRQQASMLGAFSVEIVEARAAEHAQALGVDHADCHLGRVLLRELEHLPRDSRPDLARGHDRQRCVMFPRRHHRRLEAGL